MAIGWLTVLKVVPWVELARNAPKIAEGARKLWDGVAGEKRAPTSAPAPGAAPVDGAAPLVARVDRLEADRAHLRGQLLASTDLINQLASQNAQLTAGVEALRARVVWLTRMLIVVGLLALAALVLALTR
jgi:hypothetical protein